MSLTVNSTKEDEDLVLSQLRKKEDGTDDLTPQQWLEEAWVGKVNCCKKHAYMAAFKQRQ